MKELIKKLQILPLKIKIELVIAALLTISLAIAVPVYAWFSSQKKAAEMYKIKYPSSLYINAAHREDRKFFNLDELDLDAFYLDEENRPTTISGESRITKQLYAFSVSGEGTTSFTLQLAHTNNNELKYAIYEAVQTAVKPSGDTNYENVHYVHYVRNIGKNLPENPFSFSDDLFLTDEQGNPIPNADVYYIKKGENPTPIAGEIKNPKIENNVENELLANKPDNESGINADKYYEKTYGTNLNVQENAVPTYWQANIDLARADIDRNTKQFHKYYILEVSWETSQENTKETDMVYLAVKRNS